MIKNVVQPIKDVSALNKILDYLKNYDYRYYTIFIIGIYSGLRVSDILKLNIEEVENKDFVCIREQKTRKIKKFPLKNEVQKAIKTYLKKYRNKYWGIENCENALFLGKQHCRLDRSQVYRILNNVALSVGLYDVNIGTHTMRKTFGYHHYKQNNDLALLQKIFNHSSPAITLRYIGIEQDEINKSYNDFSYSYEAKPYDDVYVPEKRNRGISNAEVIKRIDKLENTLIEILDYMFKVLNKKEADND